MLKVDLSRIGFADPVISQSGGGRGCHLKVPESAYEYLNKELIEEYTNFKQKFKNLSDDKNMPAQDVRPQGFHFGSVFPPTPFLELICWVMCWFRGLDGSGDRAFIKKRVHNFV